MADAGSKSGILARAQKRLSRTKTKVLQNLGKADRTTDEQFDELVVKIDRQQESAHHLQKELKKYLHCVEALSAASKTFYSAIDELYEAEWTEASEFRKSIQESEVLWEGYLQNLHEKVAEPMNNHLANFPPLKARIAKRGRKLMYFDNAKHSVDVIQMAKKKDEAKVRKAHDDLAQAKQVYQAINNELHQELPEFSNSRVTFYGQLFNNFFQAEELFHGNLAKIGTKETEITEKLQKDFKDFVYTPRRPISKTFSEESGDETVVNGDHSMDESGAASFTDSNPGSPVKENGGDSVYGNQSVIDAVKKTTQEVKEEAEEVVEYVKESVVTTKDEIVEKISKPKVEEKAPSDVPDYSPPKVPETDSSTNGVADKNLYDVPTPLNGEENTAASKKESSDEKDHYHTPASNKPLLDAPPNVLYQVVSTHPYNGEDSDELSFESGELIWVVPYENEDEQDDGWVMGVKQSDGIKGVFPENFTKKVDT